MKEFLLSIFLVAEICFPFVTKGGVPSVADPLQVAKLIGDKLVRETPFAYRLELATDGKEFNGMQMIDFGRNFTVSGKTSAYAYTRLEAPEKMEMEIQLGHNDACKIWLNGEVVYQNDQDQHLDLIYDERSIELPFHFTARLKKGANSFLIKTVTSRSDWRIYLQPPSFKGAVQDKKISYPEIGLDRMERVDKRIASISNWLIIGPFLGGDSLDKTFSTMEEPVFGQMFKGAVGAVTWGIPKAEVIGNLIDSLPWGTNYTWNYHNGGVAWAMKILGEMSGEMKYEKYANDFCDFQLRSIPFIKYETETLGKTNVPNGLLNNTPLLDFTLAPSLPLIYRLRKDTDFENRKEYKQFINKMLQYADIQWALPDGAKPEEKNLTDQGFSWQTRIWIDDMFMITAVQAQAYRATGEKKYIDRAAKEMVLYLDTIQLKNGLFYHSPDAHYSWGRGNGWMAVGMAEILRILPKDNPNRDRIMDGYHKMMAVLLKYQEPDGMWRQIIDDPEAWKETSGTAMFTYAMVTGIKNGWLDQKTYGVAACKGWLALISYINADDELTEVCEGTNIKNDRNHYMQRKRIVGDLHGQAPLLWCATALLR